MRFYKPGATEYQSQFSPLNLDFMQKNLVQKEANDLVAEDLIDKASQLKIKGGNYTKDEEIKKYQDWIDTNTATIRDKFYSGELDAKEAARNLGKISQFYNTNEVVKRINNDYVYSQAQNKAIAEGKLNQGVGTNFSYLGETPTWNKVRMKDLTDDQHAALYNVGTPGDFLKDHKEWYDNINTTQLGELQRNNGFKIVNDEKSGMQFMVDGSGQKVTRGRFREALKPFAEAYAKENFKNTNLGSVDYMRRLGKDEKAYSERLLDSYSGYFKLDEDTRDSRYSPLRDNNVGPKAATTDGGTAYPAAGKSTERGIKNVDTFKNNLTSFFKGDVLNTTPTQSLDPRSAPGVYAQKNKTSSDNFTEDDRKLMSHYFKLKASQTGNQYYQHLSEDILKGKNVDFLKSDSYYNKPEIKKAGFLKDNFIKEITDPKFLARMAQVDVRSNNVVEDLPYDAPEFYAEAGIRNSATTPANLEDFLASALATQSKMYDIEEGKVIEPGKIKEEYKDLPSSERASTRVGITKYRPENNFSISIGDGNNWANAYQVNIGGKPYAVQAPRHYDPVRKQKEYDNEMINKIYTTLTLGMPGEVLHWGNGDWVYDDSDKNNPQYVEMKSGTKVETPVQVYMWGYQNR